ncbi:MAG: class I SAM-dependent methyltransferase [Candidatus Hodarchaeota archaeon]
MNCNQCQGIEETFNRKTAEKELRQYRKKGPARHTRILLKAILERRKKGTLLDIGGGVGAIQHELLRSGMTDAIDVDASPAYLAAAKEEAELQGHDNKISFYLGNFVDLAPTIPMADVVTLDRVLCCYDDVTALVDASSRHAKEIYGIVYPRDSWLMKAAFFAVNIFQRVLRRKFRIFLHPREEIHNILNANDFEEYFRQKAGMWQVEAFRRLTPQ